MYHSCEVLSIFDYHLDQGDTKNRFQQTNCWKGWWKTVGASCKAWLHFPTRVVEQAVVLVGEELSSEYCTQSTHSKGGRTVVLLREQLSTHNKQLPQLPTPPTKFFSRLILIPFCRLCKAKRWALCEGQKSFIHEMRRSLSMFEYLHSSSYTNCYWGGSKMFCAMLWCWICCYPAVARSFHGESLTADIVCLFLWSHGATNREQSLWRAQSIPEEGEPVTQSKIVFRSLAFQAQRLNLGKR